MRGIYGLERNVLVWTLGLIELRTRSRSESRSKVCNMSKPVKANLRKPTILTQLQSKIQEKKWKSKGYQIHMHAPQTE